MPAHSQTAAIISPIKIFLENTVIITPHTAIVQMQVIANYSSSFLLSYLLNCDHVWCVCVCSELAEGLRIPTYTHICIQARTALQCRANVKTSNQHIVKCNVQIIHLSVSVCAIKGRFTYPFSCGILISSSIYLQLHKAFCTCIPV